MAILTDGQILLDPMSDLKAVYPNILGLEYQKKQEIIGAGTEQSGEEISRKDIWLLFSEFFENVTGKQPDQETLKRWRKHGERGGHETN